MEERKRRINEFLTGDVKTNFTPTDYKKIMSKNLQNNSSLLTDIAYQLLIKGLEVHNNKFNEFGEEKSDAHDSFDEEDLYESDPESPDIKSI